MNEHPADARWYELTGPQRRLVNTFLSDLENSLAALRDGDPSPDTKPSALDLMMRYNVSEEVAVAASEYLAELREGFEQENKVRWLLFRQANND